MKKPFALLLLLSSIACRPETGPDRAPLKGASVLLVTIDTLRADRLGCYGYKLAETPVIDALARRGVLFEEAFSAYPLTLPSHTSLLTGTVSPYHGVRNNGTCEAVDDLVTLAELMSQTGRRTAAFVSAFVLDSQFGLDQGFEHYDDVPQRAMNLTGVYHERVARETTRAATRWFDTLGPGEPFFAWVHYFDPHAPYHPPGGVPERMRTRPYDAEVAWVDGELGRLLDHLRATERLDETLVVLTSDHGESLGEHGENTHGFFVYQSVLHVPLIFSHPSLPRALRREDWVSLIDIVPTILDLVGGPRSRRPPPARSLRPALEARQLDPAPIFFECLGPLVNYGWAPLQGVAMGGFKWIRAPRPELYRLDEDPQEAHDLNDSHPQVAASMERSFRQILERNHRPDAYASPAHTLNPADRTRLNQLGYLQGWKRSSGGGEGPLDRLDPKDGIARIEKRDHAWRFYEKGQYDKALALILELLAEDPDNPTFHSHAGALLIQLGEPSRARDHLKRALDGGLVNPGTCYNLGLCEQALGDMPAAESAMRKALAADPKHLLALMRLGDILVEQGKRGEARQFYERFLELWQGGASVRAAVSQKLRVLEKP